MAWRHVGAHACASEADASNCKHIRLVRSMLQSLLPSTWHGQLLAVRVTAHGIPGNDILSFAWGCSHLCELERLTCQGELGACHKTALGVVLPVLQLVLDRKLQ